MYGGEFDGAAAFSGGGFMPSQATQTTDPFPSALSKHRDKQTLIPLTVKQINKAFLSNVDKVNFLIDGVDVNNVKLVGMVLNKAERVTDVSFVLDDGTGRIDCNRWVHEAVDTKEMEAILEGMYVQVHGQLKGFQGKKQLVIFGNIPNFSWDLANFHTIERRLKEKEFFTKLFVHIHLTKFEPAHALNFLMYQGEIIAREELELQRANAFEGLEGPNMLESLIVAKVNELTLKRLAKFVFGLQ
ncbi:replication protein A 32 kDa subunit B [Helianthus annuus]|uniref:replication protein A 32 kDa subunit B n=1 Tax=Helianthus annuus TaxID=4232 RepID=UPI000B909337|nr:replication protein A 32 kDa subunit B [Helianthus annuus]